MGVQNVKAPALIQRAQKAARAGDLSGAEALYREVLARYPGNVRARRGLSDLRQDEATNAVPDLLALWNSGAVTEALDLAETLPLSHPTVRDVRAAALRKLGRAGEAINIYDAALTSDPSNPKLWFNAGAARLEANRLSEAAEHLSRACDLSPEPPHILALLRCRLDQGYFPEVAGRASSLLTQSGLSKAETAQAHRALGTAQLNLGQAEDARASFEAAQALTPSDPELLHDLGIAANATGDTDAAREAFHAAVTLAPTNATLHRSLSGVLAYTEDDPHLAQMTELLERGLPAGAEAELRFALSKAHDDLGDIPSAASGLITANALRRQAWNYDPARDAALFALLKSLSPPELHSTPSDAARPIFVVGMPRSGTTLAEQVISGAPGVLACGELPVASQAAAEFLQRMQDGMETGEALAAFATRVRKDFASYAQGHSVIIDKMPLNFRWAEILLAALPDARVVWMERAPAANAFSLFRHCFAGPGNAFAYGAEDIATTIVHEREMREAVKARFPDRVHVLPLKDLTETPEPTIRALIAFCGLAWDDACLSPQSRRRLVLTASNRQVRQPIEAKRDPWEDYAPFLFPLAQALRNHGLAS